MFEGNRQCFFILFYFISDILLQTIATLPEKLATNIMYKGYLRSPCPPDHAC